MSPKLLTKYPFLKDTLLCLLSFLLLRLSFPRFDFWPLAFFALVPFFLILDGKKPLAAFGWGYFFGVIFFGATFYWFIYVTWLGAALLILYLAVYLGFFGIIYALGNWRTLWGRLLWTAAGWVVVEFFRGQLLTGFGWAFLGHSQYLNLPFIQLADITGVAGLSFVLVAVNYLLKEWVLTLKERRPQASRREIIRVTAGGILILLIIFSYGFMRLKEFSVPPPDQLKAAVIQPNIALSERWQPALARNILKKHLRLTERSLAAAPQLVIWPESAFPGLFEDELDLFSELKTAVRDQKIPLLFGAVTLEAERYFNSALLFSRQGSIVGKVDKLHLVPFGEYIPFREQFPFLSRIVPIDDFTPGRGYQMLSLEAPAGSRGLKKLAVLICFEDTVSGIAREFVRRGADVLINITNDAWFADTPASFLHLQAAALRSIENRRSLIRAANTGVSCFIAPSGKITDVLRDASGRMVFTSGFVVSEVPLLRAETFYTKFGDIFTYFCFGGILLAFLGRRIARGR